MPKRTANQIRNYEILQNNPAFLHDLYAYDPDTGEIRTKERSLFWYATRYNCEQFNNKWANKPTFDKTFANGRHKLGNYFGSWMKAPILIYAMQKGEWLPDNTVITYKDGDFHNTAWDNLEFSEGIAIDETVPGVQQLENGSWKASLIIRGELRSETFESKSEANTQQLAWLDELVSC